MKNHILFVFFSLLFLSLYAQYSDAELENLPGTRFKFMVIVSSACDNIKDIKIGNEDITVFNTNNLKQYTCTPFTPVDYEGYYYVYSRNVGDEDWTVFWDDDFDLPYEIDLIPGEILGFIISPEGNIRDISIDYLPSHNPQVMFVNLTDLEQYNLEISNQHGSHNNVYYSELNKFSFSDMKTIDNGNYYVYWDTRDVKDTNFFNYYPDSSGNPALVNFTEENWYLVLTYDIGMLHHRCNFINISPTRAFLKPN
ncbi:MAG TPA: hypothetical protein PLF50_04960 [Candidatus Cloacimonadota bacterium]|nr:hypothetical protein [Candidatus Cloacimonadota bacterium]